MTGDGRQPGGPAPGWPAGPSSPGGFEDVHAGGPVLTLGPEPQEATIGLVLLHGRGAGADDIIGLVEPLRARGAPEVSVLAPEAVARTWYPYPFVMPPARNEPYLSSALATVARCVERFEGEGIPRERIVVAGFSQGACLASEFVARAGGTWGGMVALSGGLIGDTVEPDRYVESLSGTAAFFGCSDVDPHIPERRVHESARQYQRQGAEVVVRIYPGMPHTVIDDELVWFAEHLHGLEARSRTLRP